LPQLKNKNKGLLKQALFLIFLLYISVGSAAHNFFKDLGEIDRIPVSAL
jgi:hypothetical protein